MKYEPYEYQSYASRFILEHPYCGLILDMKDSNHAYGIICIGIGLLYSGENSCHST